MAAAGVSRYTVLVEGESKRLSYNPSGDTVWDAKETIGRLSSRAASKVRFFVNGYEFPDTRPLRELTLDRSDTVVTAIFYGRLPAANPIEARQPLPPVPPTLPMYIDTLIVKRLNGPDINLQYDTRTATFATIKKKIEEVEGIPASQIQLIFAGRKVSDEDRPADRTYRSGSGLSLVIESADRESKAAPRPSSDHEVVFFKTIAGSNGTIDYDPRTATWAMIKTALAEKLRMPESAFRMFVGSWEVQPEQLAWDILGLGIDNADSILVVRVPGGPAMKELRLHDQHSTDKPIIVLYNEETDTWADIQYRLRPSQRHRTITVNEVPVVPSELVNKTSARMLNRIALV